MQVSFEEASIARAGKRAARLAAMRAGNYRMGAGTQKARRPPFDLGRMRRPELAFLWKNLLSTASYLRLRNALVAAAVIVGGCLWLERSEFFQSMRPALGMVALVMMVYTLVFGPQLARQDFRSDLPNTDILKTYPLRGWQVMLGEMLTPAAILTGLLWLMLLAAAMLFVAPPRMGPIAPGLRTGVTLGLALLAPLLCLAQLLIVNAFAVLFPAWQPAAGQSQQGIEVMGQRILFVAAQMLAMVLSLVPAIVVGGVVFAALRWMAGPVAGGVAGLLVGAGVMVVELGLAIAWLGARFEALDLSQELRP
jgi:hypothetical protein